MMNTQPYRYYIEKENPAAIDADMEQVNAAARLSFYDDGWEELKDNCITNAARDAIDNIERIKYRREECSRDME